ncbi:HlyD family efflux transporter periplasmic adaptor subunit [Marinomonas algicola]|uniref:HlyD family efflux transporter periplasmic adaptor subunit n=1 Tax=Marinomonas algicola TaxID=2773454 RepID=UPI0017487B23|nr:HlyD family efflux transporter periplasmic adaptor subunit [Marinomonas algicola]
MRYSFREIHTLNILSDNPIYSQYFRTPNDLKVMVWIILLCFLVATVGAFLFTVDKIVPARGIIDTKSELFDVRNTEPGFIEKMFVREGDLVNMGQVLIQFDTEFIDLEINSLQQQKDNLSRNIWSDFFQIKKLIDTQTKTTLSLSLEKIPNPINQLGYGEYLSKPFLDTKAVNDERQRNLVEQVRSGQRQQDNIRARIVLQQKERQRIKRLYIDGIESLSSLDQVEANVLSLQAQYESNLDKVQSLEAEIQQLEKQQTQAQSEYVLDRLIRIHDQLDNFHRIEFELSSKQRTKTDLKVTSPIDGTIDALMVQGDNERIPETTTLLSIRPRYSEQDLEIDIQIPASYAIWVNPGMVFRASSLGNNPDDHGYILGEITFIAASSQIDESSSERVYRMKGKISEIKALRVDSKETLLRPGSALTVDIRAGERRLINYIFDPFTKYLRTALSEPS